MKKLCAKTDLTYLMCEDWFIYAYDENGNIYYLNTETWGAWLDIAEEKHVDMIDLWKESNAIEKYMLPIAKENWDHENWMQADDFTVWNMWPSDENLESIFKQYHINLPINKGEIKMSRLKNKLEKISNNLEKTADTQVMQALQQKGGEIKKILANIQTELGTVLQDLQDPAIVQDGTAMGIDAPTLTKTITDFNNAITTALGAMQ
jgi:hypothetical protein